MLKDTALVRIWDSPYLGIMVDESLDIATYNKNSAEVNIAPASGKITNNVKYRSRAPG